MRLVFVKFGCGPTMESAEVYDFEGMSEEDMQMEAYHLAIEEANTYGSFMGEDDFEDAEDEDCVSYTFTESDLSYDWEDYVPEKHDMYRAGGGSFLDQFKDEPGLDGWMKQYNILQ